MTRPVSESLLPWALSQLGDVDLSRSPDLSPVAGDASARRYFRFALEGQRYVLAEAPPKTEKNREFLAVQETLSAAGVRVPRVLGADLERGYLLLEDLGDRLLLPQLDQDSVDAHYNRAFDVLLQLARVSAAGLPAYDRPLLAEELSRFPEWFVAGLLGYEPGDDEIARLHSLDDLLVNSALAQPVVLVHRDFHSRNLMLVEGDDLALIDFQDAVLGPVTYDPVSLLRDCYIRWPADRVRDWALAYRQRLLQAGLLRDVDQTQFLRWFDWMGLQRHIKVLGTFARLYLRDGKSAYLDDLPLVVDYVLEVLGQYAGEEPVFAHVEAWFRAQLVPLIESQPWSRSR